MSLRLMLEKGIISRAEFDSAMRDLAETSGARAADGTSLVVARFSTTMYGFVQADSIWDSTQSFNDLAGNSPVARPETYAGQHGRVTFGVRNSRLGFRVRAPEYHGIRASAMLEMDFLGNQPPNVTESAFFTSPTFRIRHFNLKIETPILDVLIGQYWQLFGWQAFYHPNIIEIQGVVAQLYSRTPQIRLSRAFRGKFATVEVAAAIMRPPQRDSATPEGQAGVRVAFNRWTGMQTTGATGTSINPASIALTGDIRRFRLPEFTDNPTSSVSAIGWGIAADAFVPIIRATEEKKGNSLSVVGEFAYGYGIADLYTGLTGGVSFPNLPSGQTFTPDIDPGLAVYTTDGALHAVQWMTYNVGAQYYLPRLDGRMWLSGYYGHTGSNNSAELGAGNMVRVSEDMANGNIMGDVLSSVRLGLGYSYYRDHYADGTVASNHRVQFSAFYIF